MNKQEEKLRKWQNRFHRAMLGYESTLTKMEERQAQYRGDRKLRNSGQKDEPHQTCHVWNITAENIDSEIDSVIPPCKVTALRKCDENLAKKIEKMIALQMDRMPVEELNDICERTVKIQGGVIYLPEWDNGKRTHTTHGEITLTHVHPKQFIPQCGVSNIDDMDYYFLLVPQTKESIMRRYGVRVHDESEEYPEARAFDAEHTDDMVTMIMAHYRNDDGFVGLFAWVGETVVADFDDYLARADKKCTKCGSVQNGDEIALEMPVGKDGTFPQGSKRRNKKGTCAYCGGKLENTARDALRVHLSDLPVLGMPIGVIDMLRQKARRVNDGEFLPPMMIGGMDEMGAISLPQSASLTAPSSEGALGAVGEAVRRVVAPYGGDMGFLHGRTGASAPTDGAMLGASGMPRATGNVMGAVGEAARRVVAPYGADMEEIEIPYFKPESYPAVLQRNITTFGELLGESDCDKIADQQNTVNRVSNKIIGRVLDAGSTVGLPSDTTITIDRQDRKIWRFKTAADIQMVKQFDFTGDISPHLAVLSQAYEESRRILGITDSFQGRRDSTATSGKAKEFAAAQSAGRLESKKVLKAACWQRIYKRIFELMLAYCDEKRPMVTRLNDGTNDYDEWNKWEFLQVDEAGEVYWNTDFIFSTDDASALAQNRMMLWQEATGHLTSGAYGNPGEIQTLITFWEAMAANHYPGAETIAAQLKERAQQQAQAMQMQQQAQMMGQQMPTMT